MFKSRLKTTFSRAFECSFVFVWLYFILIVLFLYYILHLWLYKPVLCTELSLPNPLKLFDKLWFKCPKQIDHLMNSMNIYKAILQLHLFKRFLWASPTCRTINNASFLSCTDGASTQNVAENENFWCVFFVNAKVRLKKQKVSQRKSESFLAGPGHRSVLNLL